MTRRGFLGTMLGGAAGASLARPAQAAASHPPLGAFVGVGGTQVHYVSQGEGPAVVLIHGASGNLRDFTFSLAPRLAAQGLRVVAFDRPGLGYSDRAPVRGWSPMTQARVLRAAAGELGLEQPVVVGHSWGGAVAMAWAVETPGAVRGVVSLAGATYPWKGGVGLLYDLAATNLLGPLIGGVARLVVDVDQPAAVVGRIFAPDAPPPGYPEYVGVPLALRSPAFRHNAEDLTHLNDALAELAPRYRGLRVPVEAVHGGADETVWASVHSEPLTRDVAQGRLTLLPGVGHMPHHAEEEAVVAAILRLARA